MKLSESGHEWFTVAEVAALESSLAAKDAEIARLREALEFYLHDPTTLNSHIAQATLAETPKEST